MSVKRAFGLLLGALAFVGLAWMFVGLLQVEVATRDDAGNAAWATQDGARLGAWQREEAARRQRGEAPRKSRDSVPLKQ